MSVRQCLRGLLSFMLLSNALSVLQVQAEGSLAVRLLDQNGAPVVGAIVSVTGAPAQKVTPQVKIMDQIQQSFVPHVLLINAGDPVSFPNSDNIRHHVYSFSEPKVFEIKLYADRPEAPVVFDKPGLVVLGCNIHDSMLGYIYVSPTAYAAITAEDGSAALPVPSTYTGIQVWHEYYALDETAQLAIPLDKLASLRGDGGIYTLTVPLLHPDTEDAAPDGGGFGNPMRR